jgi:diaminobutyrate-2-oxoglutarate transaminase
VAETSGPESQVLKLLPPLVVDDAQLEAGLQIIEEAIVDTLGAHRLYSIAATSQDREFINQNLAK